MGAVVRATPRRQHVATDAALAGEVVGVGRANGDHAANCRTSVQRRRRSVQHLDALNQARIDEIPRGVREAADIELIGHRHAVDDDCNPVAADATNIDAFGAESRAGGLVVDPRHVAKDVIDGGGEIIIELGPRQHGHVCRDFADRPLILVRDNDDLLDRLGFHGRYDNRVEKNARCQHRNGRYCKPRLSPHILISCK